MNIDLSFYSDVPEQFWNYRLTQASSAADVSGVRKCLSGNLADVNYRDPRGWTPLHCIANILHDRAFNAVKNGHLDHHDELRKDHHDELGKDNPTDQKGRKRQVFDILLKERKANVHLRTLRGELPLALAEARAFDCCADALRKEMDGKGKKETEERKRETRELPLERELREQILF